MSFYPFLREDSEGIVRYTFYTDNDLTYIAYFTSAEDYGDFIDGSHFIKRNGWVCGFHPINSKPISDTRIKHTIARILEDFLKEKLPKAVILYHCDDDNARHHARNKLFKDWHKTVQNSLNLTLETTEIDTFQGDTIIERNYIGCIYSRDLTDQDIKQEIASFSRHLLLALRK